jgi:hypothetical protein
VSERGWEVVNTAIKKGPKREVGERGREMVNVLIKVPGNSEGRGGVKTGRFCSYRE